MSAQQWMPDKADTFAEGLMEILRDAMEGVADYAVPLSVEIQIGNTWFEAK